MKKMTRAHLWRNCIGARENEANQCFAGGDKNHQQQIDQAWKVVVDCGGMRP
jgi:hypothetical protein